jgi:hypothetical protein
VAVGTLGTESEMGDLRVTGRRDMVEWALRSCLLRG